DEEQQATYSDVKSEDASSTINIKVVSSEGEIPFKIKPDTKLSKLQGAYANKIGGNVANIRW
ncbi:hypothetical protein B0H14DRAFT_2202729, partial [Mycena olivaceomarginata]